MYYKGRGFQITGNIHVFDGILVKTKGINSERRGYSPSLYSCGDQPCLMEVDEHGSGLLAYILIWL